ncbi:class II aldolase/adducin family protein [Halobacillus halophilus]|uniref:class II aldolase/adducin family protein n=1 Tax=Halobacillus halophilus TaxID=1570 RepID=UPI001CD5CDDE|nr:class II aldolase/adducin family protein [Halobacillus halophilus]MCA1010081.1 class II aldolase/adducin family protein [Halobacillus halophilus]
MSNTSDLQNFISMSLFAGERFDLIQAGGGNTSVKLSKSEMLVKASGHLLSEVSENHGYVRVDLVKVKDIMNNSLVVNESDKRKREDLSSSLIMETITNAMERDRPSIETFLHSFLYKFTLHTHPIVVNQLACLKNGMDQLSELFPNAIIVDYKTPGIDLAIELKKECRNFSRQNGSLPKIVFLQNHGLIISSDCVNEVRKITNDVITKLENFLGVNYKKYRLTNKLSSIMNSHGIRSQVSYLSEDSYLQSITKAKPNWIKSSPLCPDTLVFCGYKVVEIKDDEVEMAEYMDWYGKYPKVVLMDGYLFFIASNIKKAKEAEEVFKAHLFTVEQIFDQQQSLELEELQYLDNWKAEKFRQTI